MLTKPYSILFLLQTMTFATLSTVDTVLVPVKIIKLTSIATQGSDTIYDYSGKVNYFLKIADKDSLNISLDFVPSGGGVPIVPYQVTGDVGRKGFVNGVNGQNIIYFKCKMTGSPVGQYTARVTIAEDTSRFEKIADSLVNLMTIQEKVAQLHGGGTSDPRSSADNTRLGIPGYYMSNGPAGVSQGVTGTASAFPSGAAISCTFDTAIVNRMGTAIGKELWAKGKYILEAPMANMVRDPRGGRDWEMLGEDPFLSARMSVAYCLGVQSVNCVVMPKHLICNDMETNRSLYSSTISERTLREIYAMPFEYTVREAKPWSIMSAYNKVNGSYCSDYTHMLTDILKTDWGFRGFVGSDYNSIQSTVNAANAGQDLEMPSATYFGTPLMNAVTLKQVDTVRLNDMVRRVLRAKVWAGVIGKLGTAAVTQYASDLKSDANKQLSLQIAHESIVLVKNDKFGNDSLPVLPLDKNQTVALVGPYANIARMDAGGSGKTSPYFSVTPQQGITSLLAAGKILDASQWQNADVVIAFLGVSGEGEGSDRNTATLEPPANQISLVNSIVAAGKKCVVVLTGGSAAIQDAWANVPAILVAWYPGEEQGDALADVLYGTVNPSGKLSATWPASSGQLPSFSSATYTVAYESSDTGRGYRYYDKCNLKPLFSFGQGLSYTTFSYSNLRMNQNSFYVGEDVIISVDITNTGTIAGDEVAQLYLHENNPDPNFPRPVKELRGFDRVTITPGATQTVSFTLHEREFAYWNTQKNAFYAKPDDYTVYVGSSSVNLPLTGTITLQSPW